MPPSYAGYASQPLGPTHKGYFHSEFGPTSFSSFESMSATLSPSNWGAHAPAMYWRSYSQDSIVATYFGHGDGAARQCPPPLQYKRVLDYFSRYGIR